MQRITADIDNKNPFFLLEKIYIALTKIKKIKFIEIKPSFSKGYHLLVYTTSKYPKNKIYKLRKLIGDDKKRIWIDKNIRKGFGEQTLFSSKINFKNKNKKRKLKSKSK